MLIHWQSHQEYLNFLHETKVHLDSSQRIRLQLEFGSVREKLRLLDLDPVMESHNSTAARPTPMYYAGSLLPASSSLPASPTAP